MIIYFRDMSFDDDEDPFVEKDYFIGEKAKGMVMMLIQLNLHILSKSN